MSTYDYPLEATWTQQEIVDVITFFNLVEMAYEAAVSREELLAAYRKFKLIVPGKSEERAYFDEFEKSSSYSSYHVVKQARNSKESSLSLKR